MPSLITSAAVLGALALGLSTQAANWPAWRGADGQGTSTEKNLPTRWSATENIRWKISLPDRGNSTPVVWGDRVFVTQAIEEKGQRTLMCFARRDGKLLWQKSVPYAVKEETHESNPYCSASPATDGERVIVTHGSAGVFCYDFAGQELWKRDLGKQEFGWGGGSSPVLHGDVCILYHGPGQGAKLISLDKKSGKTLWEYAEPSVDVKGRTDGFRGKEPGMICTYSTPILVRAAGRDELVMAFPRFVRGFDPKTGKELWSCDGLNPLIYTSPMAADGVVVAMGGYFGNTVAVKTGGQGDVTESHRLWQTVRGKGGIGTGLIHEGRIYSHAGGIVECLDLQTGQTLWSERLKSAGAKGESWSSMVRAGELIYLLNQSGDCAVFRAGKTFEQVGVNSLGSEMCNASLAPSDGDLFIRTHQHLWCVGGEKKTVAK
jgi:outer membrane protein assembly factor BamB